VKVPPQARALPDGRLHLQHGPIDLILGVSADPAAKAAAFRAATVRFATVLDELCAELAGLRAPAGLDVPPLHGPVARRMAAAVRPYVAHCFITPMAAMAGAVADEMLAAVTAGAPLRRAYVNNGGDIALHLSPGERFRIGMVDRPDRPGLFGAAEVRAGEPIRGLATSGWRGRSFSLGIADAVTVLAATAAEADAAATVIANAVDLPGHSAIHRTPASELQPDSDLRGRRVTTAVEALTPGEIGRALDGGARVAGRLLREGLIAAAAMHCQGTTRVAGAPVLAREAAYA
jgi:ApbE superfamily uncharacterized protein (UPF0280 family)